MATESGFWQDFSLPVPSSQGNLKGFGKWAVWLLFLLPIGLIVFKLSTLPGADLLSKEIALRGMPENIEERLGYVLFVPLAAVVVVFFRVTLGIRLLGPFRSILLALAFSITGVGIGLIFLVAVIGVIVLIRPFLKAISLPYFGRVSVVLSAVAIMIMIVLVAGQSLEIENLHQVAFFPIVVLCLMGDGFARTLNREGSKSALWRGTMTALVAVLITMLWKIPGFLSILISFPELLILEMGLIIVIAEFFGFRLFQSINPVPLDKKNKKKKNKTKPVARK